MYALTAAVLIDRRIWRILKVSVILAAVDVVCSPLSLEQAYICGRSPALVAAKVVAQFSLVVAICIAYFAKTMILAARALARK